MPSSRVIPTINLPIATTTASAANLPSSASSSHHHVKGRQRSASIVTVEEVGGDSLEEVLDQNAYKNINSEWVNGKGAWVIHPVLIIVGKILVDVIPGMHQDASWTIVNLTYLLISYTMFHWVTGIPFDPDSHSGAYDDLTLWEQIDEGAQYTPSKKWLICMPIALFLISTHYTHYNPWLFAINFTALLVVLFPKLPQLHRQRIRFLYRPGYTSGAATPATGTPTPIPSPKLIPAGTPSSDYMIPQGKLR